MRDLHEVAGNGKEEAWLQPFLCCLVFTTTWKKHWLQQHVKKKHWLQQHVCCLSVVLVVYCWHFFRLCSRRSSVHAAVLLFAVWLKQLVGTTGWHYLCNAICIIRPTFPPIAPVTRKGGQGGGGASQSQGCGQWHKTRQWLGDGGRRRDNWTYENRPHVATQHDTIQSNMMAAAAATAHLAEGSRSEDGNI